MVSKGKGKGQGWISIFGTGYVGIVSAASFLKNGHKVICVDILPEKVAMVNRGISPVFEPGVDKVLGRGLRSGRLVATTDGQAAVKRSVASFISVGTPSKKDGSIDLRYIRAVAKEIGAGLKNRKGYHVVVVKSTVVPGTTLGTVLPLLERHSEKRAGKDFGLACNPEFLREGEALKDSLAPDRVVIGGMDKRSRTAVERLYKDIRSPKVLVDITTAETIKYISNAFLAARIALTNEMANLCSAVGVDVYEVMEGVGLDHRIGPDFLRAGAGFGGSCFPKDLRALVRVGEETGTDLMVLRSVLRQNELQPLETVRLLKEALGSGSKTLDRKAVALLGVAFKPDTDDIRETRARPIVKALLKEGAKVRVHDPNETALDDFMGLFSKKELNRMTRCDNVMEALKGVHGCIVQTEWKEFKELKPSVFKRNMKKAVVIDGRRTFDPEKMARAGITYKAIGWKNPGSKD